MTSSPRVLVIDESSDTETVLRAVLEPRGTSVGRHRSQRQASQAVSSSHPTVVVIDLDGESESATPLAASTWQTAPRILLGTHRPAIANPRERFLEKPFQYPELVRVIEELLDSRDVA